MSETSASAGARLRAAVEAERPLQVVGAINAYSRAARGARRVSRALPLRRRRGQRLLRPAGPRHHHAQRCLRGRAPHHRRQRAAAAGRCRHRLGRRVQHRPHDARPDPRRAPPAAPRRPGAGQALRPSPGQGARRQRGDGRSHQGRRRWRAPIAASSSWRAPMRTRSKGQAAAIERAQAYVEAGADMIFAEALTTLDEYRAVHRAPCSVPVLANITEFGKTPLFTRRRARRGRRAAGAVSALRVPRDERGGAEAVYGAIRTRRHAEERRRPRCRRAPSCTTCSAITTTSRSSMSCSREDEVDQP